MAALLVTATVAGLARASSAASRFSLWAEDVPVFVGQSRHNGFIRSLLTTYNGYFHFLPRSVAGVALFFPLRWTPQIYTTFAALIAAGCAFVAGVCGRRLGLSRPAGAILAVVVLLLPAGGYEILNTLTNVQWHVLPAAVVFLAAWIDGFRPPLVITGLLLLVAGLTTPLLVVCLPFALLRALTRRARLDVLIVSVLTVTSAVQIAGRWVGSKPPPDNHHLHAARLSQLYSIRVIDDAFSGDRLLGALRGTVGFSAAVAVGMAIFTFLLLLAIMYSIRGRPVPLFLVSLSFLLYALPMTFRGITSVPSSQVFAVDASRYSAGPTICILLLVVVAIDQTIHAGARQGWLRIGEVLIALSCLVLAVNFSVATGRLNTKSWSDAITQGEAACRTSSASVVAVGVAPNPATWRMALSCREAFP